MSELIIGIGAGMFGVAWYITMQLLFGFTQPSWSTVAIGIVIGLPLIALGEYFR